MRSFKLLLMLLVGGIVFAQAVPASGLTWLNNPTGERIRFNILDWTMSKSYLIGAGPPVEGVAAVNALPQLPPVPPGALPIPVPQVGPGGIGNALVGQVEDTWGVVKVQELVADPGATVFWSGASDPNSEIVGLLYGSVDTYVGVDPATGDQVVSSAGLFLDLYEQPKGIFSENLGSAGRISFTKYQGVGFDAAGNPIPGAKLLLHLESTDDKAPANATAASDIDGDGDPDGDFRAQFTPEAFPIGSGTGESSLFWDLLGGAWFPTGMEVQPFYFPALDPRFGTSQYADLHSGQDFDPAALGPADWIVTSDDPTRGYFVPEPVTMAGLMLGIGSLLGYVRRRR